MDKERSVVVRALCRHQVLVFERRKEAAIKQADERPLKEQCKDCSHIDRINPAGNEPGQKDNDDRWGESDQLGNCGAAPEVLEPDNLHQIVAGMQDQIHALIDGNTGSDKANADQVECDPNGQGQQIDVENEQKLCHVTSQITERNHEDNVAENPVPFQFAEDQDIHQDDGNTENKQHNVQGDRCEMGEIHR